jgi:hypothetical protein
MQNTRLASLDFDLGPEIDMLRTTVRGFAEDRIAPLAEIDRTDGFPTELWLEMGRFAPVSPSGRIWRRRMGYLALRRDGGGQPRPASVGSTAPTEPLRQPDPAQQTRRRSANTCRS